MSASAPALPADRPLLGVLLVVLFCVLAPLGDAIGKLLGALPLAILLLARYGVQAAIALPLLLGWGPPLALSARVWRLTVLRTVLHVLALGSFFAALRFLPMADAVAISFVMPFILLILGRLSGEQVGPHRLAACAVGFVGTLMVVQPSFAAVGAPALLPLATAVLFSLFMLVTRVIAREADPIVLQAASGLVATAVLAPLVALAAGRGWPDLSPVALAGRDVWLLLFLGVFGTASHLVMTFALRFAPSSTLAPMQYLELPCATLVGWLVFGDLPNGLAATGIVVTIAAGLYVIHREHRAARPPAPPAP